MATECCEQCGKWHDIVKRPCIKEKTMRAPSLKVEKALNGQFYVVLRGGNGEKVVWSETYTRKADAMRAKKAIARLIQEVDAGL